MAASFHRYRHFFLLIQRIAVRLPGLSNRLLVPVSDRTTFAVVDLNPFHPR